MNKKPVIASGTHGVIGPYSPAIISGEWVFCSGQIGIDPETGQLVQGGIEEQTARCIMNLKGILCSVGLDLTNVVKTTVFLTDIGLFDKMNKVYESFFTSPYPARTTIQVARLPKDALVEIEAIARLVA